MLGTGVVPLSDVIRSSSDSRVATKVTPPPLFVPNEPGGWLSLSFLRTKRRRVGTLFADLTYFPLEPVEPV